MIFFLLEEIKKVCMESERKVEFIDDLTFGDYLKMMENAENWDKLGLPCDKKLFIQKYCCPVKLLQAK